MGRFPLREDDDVAIHGPRDPVYTIGVAARLLGVTPRFLRQIEGERLITPARTESNIRLYSDEDIRLLKRIVYLWRDCGINSEGVRVILAMEEAEREQARAKQVNGNRLALETQVPEDDTALNKGK